MAQHYASWATPVWRFMNLLEQTDNFAVFELDAICGRNLRQAWHGHDVSGYNNYEFGSGT